MWLFYGSCQLVQEQKGVLEPPELPPGYATGINRESHIHICTQISTMKQYLGHCLRTGGMISLT